MLFQSIFTNYNLQLTYRLGAVHILCKVFQVLGGFKRSCYRPITILPTWKSRQASASDFLRSHIYMLQYLKNQATSVFSNLPKWGFWGVKTAPENWGAAYLFNCFAYNSGMFRNETNSKNFLPLRGQKGNFLKFIKKFLRGWATQK